MIDPASINSLFDAEVLDPDGERIGTVKQVFVDAAAERPLFASVGTGLFGTSESFVPLHDAVFDGTALRVNSSKDAVKHAPRIDADGSLTDEQQGRLWDYYAGAHGDTDADADAHAGTDDTAGRRADAEPERAAGVDDRARESDDSMTRSEERLSVSTESVPTTRAKLRKYVVTEQQTVTVPVQHEEVWLVREPVDDGDAEETAKSDDAEPSVLLHEDRVSVDKETVPVEQVRLEKQAVTEEQQVTEDVAREEIELDERGNERR